MHVTKNSLYGFIIITKLKWYKLTHEKHLWNQLKIVIQKTQRGLEFVPDKITYSYMVQIMQKSQGKRKVCVQMTLVKLRLYFNTNLAELQRSKHFPLLII